MESFVHDARHAFRALFRNPGFTGLAVLTLALGIGANTAVFSVVSGILLRSLPYSSPDRIVRVLGYRRDVGLGYGTTSRPNLLDLRQRTDAFEAFATYDEWQPTITGGDEPQRVEGASVSAEFFDVFGVQPAAGRFFIASEDEPGSVQAVVLSHGFWMRRFGGDSAVVGATVDLDGVPYTVVGIAPVGFEDPRLSSGAFAAADELWRVSPGYFGESGRTSRSFTALARLRPGISLTAAQAEADAVMAGLETDYPEANAGRMVRLTPLKDQMVGPVRRPLLIFLAAAGLVLLIACANVASLLLARASTRGREIAVRRAIGASRSRLVRQLLSESLALALVGGAIGVVLAYWATELILRVGAGGLPRVDGIAVDGRVLTFALGATVLTGLLFGLAPAIHATRSDVEGLRIGGDRGSTQGSSRRRALRALVAAEVALAIALLVCAGLLSRSFWELRSVDSGMEAAGVLTLELDPPPDRYEDQPEALAQLYSALAERLGAIPDVEAVGTVNILPLSGSFNGFGFRRADLPEPAPGEQPSAEARSINPQYFDALGIPLLRGRGIGETDRANAPPVVVINQAMAERYWPGEDPLGRQIIVDDPAQIVGIVGDVRQFDLGEAATPTLYLSEEQAPDWMRLDLKLAIRTTGDAVGIVPAVRSAIHEIDASIPISNVQTMEAAVSGTLGQPRFRALLLTLFASVALIMGAAGIYGVVSYGVARRTREVGIRLALGANPDKLVRMLVYDGMGPVLIGVATGLLAALLFGRAIAGLLYGVSTSDPATLVGVATMLIGVALLASWVPARRAARADPMTPLRNE